jgi:hypothetical protein
MGLFSGITSLFTGGGNNGSSTSASQKTEVKNTNIVDIHFEELAEVEAQKLKLNSTIFEYAQQIQEKNLTIDEKERIKSEKIKRLELLQTQEQIEQSKKNAKITIFITVIGLSMTAYQLFFKKGKK